MARELKPKAGGISRLRRFAQNHLGVVMTEDLNQGRVFRDADLDILDKYYDGEQYDNLQPWNEAMESDDYVAIRKRKPRINYNVAKVLVDKVASKLVGSATFPTFVVEDEEDDTAFFRTVQKACKFRRNMLDPIKQMLKSGAVLVRYFLVNGAIQIEYANSKYCYPVFDGVGELDSVEIKYVYDDQQELDKDGKPKQKWYKLQLSKTVDTLFDNPDYREGSTPEFTVVATAEHGLGWVQAEWLCTEKDKFNFDGHGLYSDILDFIDELNYSLSQSSQAIGYSQEPQLGINNVDEDELDALVRSSQKAWNLGRDGKAAYIESNGAGLKTADDSRKSMRNLMLDVVRVVLHDPEKMTGQAQSGEALKQLYAPLVELVDELRLVIEQSLINLLIKIGLTALHYNAQGEDTVLQTPPGYMPQSVDITVQWPPIFPATLADINLMAQAAASLSQGQIISRETLTRWVAQVIPSVDNVEEELQKIATQEPLPSPFGTFGGEGE